MTLLNPLSTLQNNIVAFIDAQLPMLQDCRAHYGRFTAEELEVIRTKAPAIHVGLPSLRGAQPMGGGVVEVSVMSAIAIITKDDIAPATETSPKRKLLKDEAMAAILSTLFTALPSAEFGAGVQPCDNIIADTLVNTKVASTGTAIWGMQWSNVITLLPAQDPQTNLAQIYYSAAPKIGAAHKDDYKIIGALGEAS